MYCSNLSAAIRSKFFPSESSMQSGRKDAGSSGGFFPFGRRTSRCCFHRVGNTPCCRQASYMLINMSGLAAIALLSAMLGIPLGPGALPFCNLVQAFVSSSMVTPGISTSPSSGWNSWSSGFSGNRCTTILCSMSEQVGVVEGRLLILCMTVLYGLPHGSWSTSAQSSFQHSRLLELMAFRRRRLFSS